MQASTKQIPLLFSPFSPDHSAKQVQIYLSVSVNVFLATCPSGMKGSRHSMLERAASRRPLLLGPTAPAEIVAVEEAEEGTYQSYSCVVLFSSR